MIGLLLLAVAPPAFGQDDRSAASRQSPAPGRQAEELFQSALPLVDTKYWELARERMQEAMQLWIKAHEPEKAASALVKMGDRYKHARNYLEALHYYKQALDVTPPSGSINADAYSAIAQVYTELYAYDLAKYYLSKAIAQAQSIKDVSTEAFAMAGLADLHHRQGESAQALVYIKRARLLNRRRGDEVTEAALQHLDGQLALEGGRTDEARAVFEEALIIYRKNGNVDGQVKVLCSMSNVSLLAGDKQAALDHAKEAVELAEGQAGSASKNADKTRARDLRWRAWFSHARAERAVGENRLAANSFLLALRHAEGIFWVEGISTEATAIAFRQESQELYREFVDLLMTQGEIDRAYWWADDDKARAIRGLTEGRKTETTKHGDQAGTLRELYRPIASLRTQLQSSHTRKEVEKLQKDLRNAEYALEEGRVLEEMKNSRNRLHWSTPANVKWLQGQLARDKSVLLEFLLGETRSFAWLITPDGVTSAILPSRKEIEGTVISYLESLTTVPDPMHIEQEITKTREQGAALFSRLFGNLAREVVPGQKLIVVPDGLLHYLPFETLVHNGRYLMEDHEISYNPSASMLSLWQDSIPQSQSSKKKDLLAFGDPDFEPRSTGRNLKKSGTEVASLVRSWRATQGYALPRLPRTRDEVEYVARLFPSDRRSVYLGKQSTEEAVKHESLRDYKRLHFATHSLIDEEFPSRSAVALTFDEDPREDGLLEVGEISDLEIDCDLVVLSACQTGRGKLFSGEGIVGLSRAFLRAGARSVVVSLWNVSDISTNVFMKTFYTQLAADVGNAAALREAKLQMIQGPVGQRHPYYWASFVIIGKP